MATGTEQYANQIQSRIVASGVSIARDLTGTGECQLVVGVFRLRDSALQFD
jgi:hypothetical protein